MFILMHGSKLLKDEREAVDFSSLHLFHKTCVQIFQVTGKFGLF